MKHAASRALFAASMMAASCAGDSGADGASALVAVSTEDPGERCAAGGLRIDTGLDDGDGGETAGDGVLGAGEIDATEYVCDGSNGTDGEVKLIRTTAEPEGENCTGGGQRIDVGLDNGDGGGTAGDGILDPGEIDATSFACNNLSPAWPAGEGIKQGLSLAALEDNGWTICHQDTYADALDDVAAQAGCQGAHMMLACREGTSDTLTVAAADTRAVVVQVDPASPDGYHVVNDVGWYYSVDWSWGFFPPTEAVYRNSCDNQTDVSEQRLCWHANDDFGGYRCGNTVTLEDDYQRLVLVK